MWEANQVFWEGQAFDFYVPPPCTVSYEICKPHTKCVSQGWLLRTERGLQEAVVDTLMSSAPFARWVTTPRRHVGTDWRVSGPGTGTLT